MSIATVVRVSDTELRARRERILKGLGLTLEQYMARADERALSGVEWEVRDDLDSIAFLLGEDAFVD
ncbi:MAG: hypothetical protein ACTIA6_12085 [Pseudoclavibacter sp.]